MSTAIEMYNGTVTGCVFKGAEIAIECFGDDAVITGNRFLDDVRVHIDGASYSQVTNNVFNGSNITAPYLLVTGTYGLIISGNYFDGNSDESQEVVSIGGGHQALTIVGNVISSGVLLDRADGNSDALTIVGNTWVAGGGILSTVVATNWRLSGVLIANNNLDAWHYGGSAFIHLTGSERYLRDVTIQDNVLSSTGVNAGAGPLIDLEFPDTTASNGRAIRIVGNKIVDRRAAVDADLAIRVTGPTTKTDGAVDVSDNFIEASDGIEITYVRDVVVRGNRIAVEEVTLQQAYYAGQLKIALCGTAVVDDNVIVSGEDGDKAATGAAISVEGVGGGSVRNNDVWGIVSGGLDTALSIDGPFYVFGNAYHGEHSLNTGTAFSTELDVIGTGATIGDNQMTVTDGGTSTVFESFDTERWAGPSTLTVKEGDYEIPFSGAFEIIDVEARVKTQPTGSAIIVDVHKNGSTIFTTPGDRPTIATSTNSDIAIPNVTAGADGDYLRVDVDQIDSNAIGQGLTVTIRYRRT